MKTLALAVCLTFLALALFAGMADDVVATKNLLSVHITKSGNATHTIKTFGVDLSREIQVTERAAAQKLGTISEKDLHELVGRFESLVKNWKFPTEHPKPSGGKEIYTLSVSVSGMTLSVKFAKDKYNPPELDAILEVVRRYAKDF
jgi:hypothetical protein